MLSSQQAVVPPEERRMGMVFQNYAVWPHMSVFENVAFGLRLQRPARAEIAERVDRISARSGWRASSAVIRGSSRVVSSSAWRWRVRWWSSHRILLLDEPLSNLDAKLRERMRTELKTLQRRTGITFVYVTHDQAEAMALSDRIVVFNKEPCSRSARPAMSTSGPPICSLPTSWGWSTRCRAP